MSDTPTTTPVPGHSARPGLLGIAAALIITAGVTGLLHARAALNEAPSLRTPLTVSTLNYSPQEQYSRTVSYLGLAVSGRKANLGFEIPGQIATLAVRQGSEVLQGDLIASLDDAALQARRRATVAQLQQVQAELELAQLKAGRQRDLRQSGAVSKEAFDETRLRARALAAQVESVDARLASIDIELDKSRLRAPYDGVVADHYVHEGAVINPGVPVVRLIGSGAREAHIGVAASRAAELVPGSNYSIKLRDAHFAAPLLSVRPDVDPVTRSTTAVFAIPEHVSVLDGEPLSLQLEQPVAEPGGWLPLAALLEGQRGVWTVLKIEPAGGQYRTVREVVEVLDVQGEQAYVRGSLDAGARIVASGVHRITPGSLVTPAEAR